MATLLAQTEVIAALGAEFSAIAGLADTLAEDEWSTATPCPGWDVRAAFSHVIGTESALAEVEAPPDPPVGHDSTHVRNAIGAANERWVAGLKTVPTDELLERFRVVTSQRLEALRQMSPADWNAEGSTPAGQDTYGRFMRIRVFDCWMHEQDIRDAIGRPGHLAGAEVDLSLDEMTAGMGFVVGKKAGAPAGSSVTFDLTGEAARRIHVRVGERAEIVDRLEGPATVTLRMPVPIFTRLGGGRIDAGDAADDVEIIGDVDLGRNVVLNLGYTI